MRLISCTVHGFGRLKNIQLVFHDGINCLLKENGWGKSTFAAFIRVMFYGFMGENKRSDIDKERKRYKPWGSDVYGGEIVFEVGEKRYRLMRSFGVKQSDDEFALYDDATGKRSLDFTENIGEELFELDADSFASSVFIGQKDIIAEITDGINAKIGNIAACAFDMRDYEAAMRTLKKLSNVKSPERRTGELYKDKQEIMRLNEKVRKIPHIKSRVEKLLKVRNETKGKASDMLAMERRVNRKYRRCAAAFYLNLLFVLLSSVVLILCLFDLLPKGYLYPFSALVLFLFVLLCACGIKTGRTKKELSDIGRDIDEYFDSSNDEKEAIAEYDMEIATLKKELSDMEELSAVLDDRKKCLKRNLHTYELVCTTRTLMEKAKESFTARYTAPVLNAFNTYYSVVSENTPDMLLDGQMVLSYREKGMFRGTDTLSKGQSALVGFCMRAAVADAMYEGEKPMLIMDDPFVNLDDKAMDKVKELIGNLSHKYQIIYFTCSKNRVL